MEGMEGNKKYVFIVIVIILLGLLVFTFVNEGRKMNENSKEEEEIKEEEKNEQEEIENNDEIQNNTETEEEKIEEDVETIEDDSKLPKNEINNLLSTTETSNSVDKVNKEEDKTYDDALDAIVKVESSLNENDYNEASSLVKKVKDTNKKEKLEKRLEETKKIMNAQTLVANLESLVSKAASKDEINKAIEYREEVLTSLKDLKDNASKEDLNNRLEELSKILDDNTPPTIEGLENMTNTQENVELTITDENKYRVFVNNEEKELENLTFTDEGKYIVSAIDSAYNESAITFVIDRTKPTIDVDDKFNEGFTNNSIINIVDQNEFNVKLSTEEEKIMNAEQQEDETYKYSIELEEDGTYTIVVTDKAGNTDSKTFTYDSVAPSMTNQVVTLSKDGNIVDLNDTLTLEFWTDEEIFNESNIQIKIGEEIIKPTILKIEEENHYVLSNIVISEYMKLQPKDKIKIEVIGLLDFAGNEAENIIDTELYFQEIESEEVEDSEVSNQNSIIEEKVEEKDEVKEISKQPTEIMETIEKESPNPKNFVNHSLDTFEGSSLQELN